MACRAGTRTAYGYGGDASLLGRFGWFQGNNGKHVHPPREFRPGRRGLFDLHGNLFEWTHDWDGNYDTKVPADPLRSNGGSFRLYRGGGWGYDAASCRSAFRSSSDPTARSGNLGFRVALSPSGAAPPEAGFEALAKQTGAGKAGAQRSRDRKCRSSRPNRVRFCGWSKGKQLAPWVGYYERV